MGRRRIRTPQADGGGGSRYHRDLKRHKHRQERRHAKQVLRRGEHPESAYNRYYGYET